MSRHHYLEDWSEDVDRVISVRDTRPFHPRLVIEREPSDVALSDGEVRAAIEMAYRRGFDQGSYFAGLAHDLGQYDRWRRAVGAWRTRYRSTRRFEFPPEPCRRPARGS